MKEKIVFKCLETSSSYSLELDINSLLAIMRVDGYELYDYQYSMSSEHPQDNTYTTTPTCAFSVLLRFELDPTKDM